MLEERSIRKKLEKDYGQTDNAQNAAKVHLIWTAWPAVAKEVGKYNPKDKNSAVDFRAKLSKLTRMPTAGFLSLAASAINDLTEDGTLDIRYVDPAVNQQVQTAASSVEGTGFLSSVLPSSLTDSLSSVKSYLKWGAVALGVIALIGGFFWLKSATYPLRKGLKTVGRAKALLSGGKDEEEKIDE